MNTSSLKLCNFTLPNSRRNCISASHFFFSFLLLFSFFLFALIFWPAKITPHPVVIVFQFQCAMVYRLTPSVRAIIKDAHPIPDYVICCLECAVQCPALLPFHLFLMKMVTIMKLLIFHHPHCTTVGVLFVKRYFLLHLIKSVHSLDKALKYCPFYGDPSNQLEIFSMICLFENTNHTY